MFELISLSEAMKRSYESEGVLVDVRSEEDFRKGHLPMAVNIPFEEIMQMQGKADLEQFYEEKFHIPRDRFYEGKFNVSKESSSVSKSAAQKLNIEKTNSEKTNPEKDSDIEKERAVFLYCDTGSTSMLAAKKLGSMGIHAYSVVGGILFYKGYLEKEKNDLWTMVRTP